LAREAWRALRAELSADETAQWWVWTTWYEARLRGDPPDLALERERVLIPGEDWEKGPAHVNAIIAGLIVKHRSTAPDVSSPLDDAAPDAAAGAPDLEALLATRELRAALADFELDAMAKLMRMVPFAEDVPDLDDPVLERDRAEKLGELADLMEDLNRDVSRFCGNAPGWLPLDMAAYAVEARKGVERVRYGRLWDLGLTFSGALADPDIEWALGTHVFAKFERATEKHLDLMRDHFAAVLSRMRGLRTIEQAPDADPEEAVRTFETAAEALEHIPPEAPVAPDPEIVAVVADRAQELEGLLQRIRLAGDPAREAQLERTFWQKARVLAVTLARYKLRVVQATGTSVGLASSIETLFPGSFARALDWIARTFPGIPGL
jgi:hypothetical protein